MNGGISLQFSLDLRFLIKIYGMASIAIFKASYIASFSASLQVS